MKIGIQGIEGSFHDLATSMYFKSEDYMLEPFMDFRGLATALKNRELDYGVMAIENTIAGSILPNYALINECDLKVSGEVYSRIELSLLVNKGVQIGDVKQVRSHPMALLQCAEYLGQYPHIKLTEADDTADSARLIKDEKLDQVAAVASRRAGELFELDILQDNIETNKLNYTRFLVLKGAMNGDDNVREKASLRLVTSHAPGSLTDVLQIFKEHDLNLTKIQSLPIIGEPYNYAFNIDLVWNDYHNYKEAMNVLEHRPEQVKIFGEYKKGNFPIQK